MTLLRSVANRDGSAPVGEVFDGGGEVGQEGELAIEQAGLEHAAGDGADLDEHQPALVLVQDALHGDELGEEDAVEAVGRLRPEAESELAAAVHAAEVEQFLGELVDLGLVQARVAEADAEDVALLLETDVAQVVHGGPSVASPRAPGTGRLANV